LEAIEEAENVQKCAYRAHVMPVTTPNKKKIQKFNIVNGMFYDIVMEMAACFKKQS